MRILVAAAALAALALPALADGDPVKGERDFGKCKACHSIVDGDNVIQKGGKIGPNLFGVVGRQAASVEGFDYGPGILAAKEKGLVWNEELLIEYVHDPAKFLTDYVGTKERTKMTFKLKNSDDVVAYLASLSPKPAEAAAPAQPAGN